ncbi:TcmI family type II polyketide cyclase [Actinomadura graeca]|uniref:TcmI family type II polyketide cyclase n=1 Tax=Actinomadura graeca TaxID=2750812 RepID=A0ABX8QSP8_9ACTN|nr:TcmI family type II polyketide cyclase [Actinomadura graeca]QXJ21839.1 TcmI family type II polyketide cyclase [Actinomadura graeca]
MHTTLIVARFRPGSEAEIARLFAESDSTELPGIIGVQRRKLFTFHDIYIHMVEAEKAVGPAVRREHGTELFQRISKALDEHIVPFEGRWGSVDQASARQIYHWERGRGVVAGEGS